MKFLPKEVRDLIQQDNKWLWLICVLAGGVALLVGAELGCLYLLGRALVGQNMPTIKDSSFITQAFATYSQAQLLFSLGVIFAAVILLRFGFQSANYYVALKWGARVTTRLQSKVMESFLLAPTSVFDKHGPGKIIHGLMEAPLGAMFAVDGVTGLITNLFTAALVGLTLIYVSPWMLLAAVLVGTPAFLIIAIPLQKKLRYLKNCLIDQRASATEMATNMISGIRDIKSLSAEHRMASAFAQRVAHGQNAHSYARFISLMPGPALQAVFQFAFAAVIIVMSSSISKESLANWLPHLAVLGYGLLRVYPAVSNISRSWLELHNALPDLRVTAEWTSLPEDELCGGTQLAPKRFQGIQFHDVSFSYNGGALAVSDLNFLIKPGKITSLVGGSGAGKSTILDLILKFRSPLRGTIHLGEKNMREVVRKDWLQSVGVVRQDVFLFGGTIRENLLEWKRDASEEEMISACRQAGVLSFINLLPDRLDTVVGDRAVTVSGGQRQRIAIARALLRDPQVLVLDEALSALDGETEAAVLQSFKVESAHRTILIVSHRLTTVQHADHIIVLDGGRVVEQGGHAELMARKGRYRQLFGTQVDEDALRVAG